MTRTKLRRLREHTTIVQESIVGMHAQGDAVRHRGRKFVTEPVEVVVPSVSVCRREPPATQHHVLATPVSVHMAINSNVLKRLLISQL
ncbi:Contains similarity to gibberellin-regulated protein 2 precursor (GAST1) homolog gb/U11765 from A. thaliana [Arabidopsis thaliana]|uniref:T22J18.14 protein n=1 Tax=Arabidopsis thaliana TaxID=3702 RepID=O80552_ARATH|nr:Contains similarity to gibberellin-regulated protein 2 precursor (GAST1) homolog gb/U11765 from A. thaliana [Arabidopsis thaliana]